MPPSPTPRPRASPTIIEAPAPGNPVAPIDPDEAYRDPDGDYSDPTARPADDPTTPLSSEPSAEPLVTCWRCDKLVPPRGRCPYCRARVGGRGYEIAPASRGRPTP